MADYRKTVYCPKCGRKVATWDGKSKINIIVICKKCNKRVVFHVDTMETDIKDLLPRECGSGLRY